MFKHKVGYIFRSASYEELKEIETSSVVVFVHGIFSHVKQAFSIKKEEFFWDKIFKVPPFIEMQFGLFSYGRVDFSFIFECETPFNSLARLSQELHGMIGNYDNVIFIAHSQGGLLAREYASIYHEEQSFFLCTLHTPHRNKSIGVLRSDFCKIWNEHVSYKIPHLFCGSANDNKIVKPFNATWGSRCKTYISKDTSKSSLGHSHLNSSPDHAFLKMLTDSVYQFYYSGFRKEYTFFDNKYGLLPVNEVFFTSLRVNIPKEYVVVKYEDFISRNINVNRFLCKKKIAFNNTSIPFVERIIKELCKKNNVPICIVNYDSQGVMSHSKVNNSLCEEYFIDGPNPYASLPFDAFSFGRKSLISNLEFRRKLAGLCREFGFGIRDQYSPHGKCFLRELYRKCAKTFWDDLVCSIYGSCFSTQSASIGIAEFSDAMRAAAKVIMNDNDKHVCYSVIYESIVRSLSRKGQVVDIRIVEIVISKIFRCDLESYWIDRDIKLILKEINRSQRLNVDEICENCRALFEKVC